MADPLSTPAETTPCLPAAAWVIDSSIRFKTVVGIDLMAKDAKSACQTVRAHAELARDPLLAGDPLPLAMAGDPVGGDPV